MASRTVEIILKAADQFSDTTKKLQLQMAAAKIATDDLNKSVEKLSQRHPGLSMDEAQAAAQALQNAKRGADDAGRSFANANIAARGLAQEIGITLPRSVTAFLGQSKLIGPALSAAFSTIAIVGMVEALGQIPAVYDKMAGAVTGWNEKSKAAFAQALEDNQKALQSLTAFQAKMAELSDGSGAQVKLNEAQARLRANTSAAVTARNPKGDFLPTLAGAISAYASGVALPSPTADEAKRLQDNANKAAADVIEAQRDIVTENKAGLNELQKQHQEYLRYFDGQLKSFKNATFSTAVETHEFRDAVIADWKSMNAEQQKAGDEYLEYQQYFSKQLEEFRIKPIAADADVAAGEKAADLSAKKIIEGYKKAQEEQKKFVASFQEEVGKLWDDFFLKGKGAFADLANLAKDLVQSFTRNIVEGLATNLAFGKGGSGGGLLGGLVGLVSKHASAGPMSEAIPGMGNAGILGSLGGLFGGPLGAGTSMGSGPLAGAVVSAPAGGLLGALGLGGGAGLLGLGAATIPVFGAVAAGLGIALMEIFKHHDAPFTRDPNAIQNTREYLFYSGVQDFALASKDMLNFTHKLNTLPTGTLVKEGLPVALASSNQFRRDVSATLLQDQ